MARKPTDEVQLKLRFSEKLRRQLDQAAERNGRSMNTEIIQRLEHSFTRWDEEREQIIGDVLKGLLDTLARLSGDQPAAPELMGVIDRLRADKQKEGKS